MSINRFASLLFLALAIGSALGWSVFPAAKAMSQDMIKGFVLDEDGNPV